MTIQAQQIEKMRSDYNKLAQGIIDNPHTEAVLMPVMENCVAILFSELAKLDQRTAEIIERNRNPRPHECPRCNGRGALKGFSHVKGGICFKCGGTGRR